MSKNKKMCNWDYIFMVINYMFGNDNFFFELEQANTFLEDFWELHVNLFPRLCPLSLLQWQRRLWREILDQGLLHVPLPCQIKCIHNHVALVYKKYFINVIPMHWLGLLRSDKIEIIRKCKISMFVSLHFLYICLSGR